MNQELQKNIKLLSEDESVLIRGSYSVSNKRDTVLVARIGDIVVGLEVYRRSELASADFFAQLEYQLSISKEVLNENSEHSLKVEVVNETVDRVLSLTCKEALKQAGFYAGLRAHDIRELFPSFGYFGGGSNQPLEVNVNTSVKAIKLFVDDSSTFLNISKFEVVDANGKVISDYSETDVSCSSIANKQKSAMDLLEGNGFHSEREDGPWFIVRFPKKVNVSKVRIYNRRDRWSVRSRKIAVAIAKRKDKFRTVHHNFSHPLGIKQLSDELRKNLSLSLLESWLTEDGSVSRQSLIEYVVTQCLDDIGAIDSWSCEFIEQLLPTWSGGQVDGTNLENEIGLLALLVYKQTLSNLNFNLLAFSGFLKTKASIVLLQQKVNRLRELSGVTRIQFTKHGIALENKLTVNPKPIIDASSVLFNDLAALNVKPCLAYGTLLGAVRDKAFIAHDDDVDLLIELPTPDLTKPQAFAAMHQILSQLDNEKYHFHSSSSTGSNLNYHVKVKEYNIVLDVFPYWYSGKDAVLHMEKMKLRTIDASILKNRKSLSFYGTRFPVPAKFEAFLEERYGETWHTPDQFHEWRWELK